MGLKRRKQPTIDSVSFDTSGWEVREESSAHRMWMTPTHDAVLLRCFAVRPTSPYDFTSIDAARKFFDAQSMENGGAVVSVDFVEADGVDLMKGIFKYRSPGPGSMGMCYVGVLTMPYRDFSIQINTEALEVGLTGGREAAVALLRNDKPPADQEPILVKSADELFKRMSSAPVRRIPADDEQYDGAFPDHPLSKVRALQARVLESLAVADVVRNSEPYRVGEA